MKGKAVLVAGATRGLGRAVAAAFAREGARVAICARHADALQETAGALRQQYGATVLPVVTDLLSTPSVQSLIGKVEAELGGLDVCVTNTAPPPRLARFEEIEGDDLWLQAFHEQFMAVMRLCRALLPLMRRAGGGRIVNMTSAAVKEYMPHHVLSSTMRMAVHGLAKHMAIELAPYNIRVNSVCQASIVTERFERLIAEGTVDRRQREATIPLGRLGRPEDLAAAVLFLASDASNFITGASLQVEGGQIRAML